MHNMSDPSQNSVKAVQMKPERLRRQVFVEQMGLSLEWKAKGVTDGQNEDGDCDEVMCARWGELTEWGWRNEDF